MIPRRLQLVLEERLRQAPVVVLTGARQVGKTTLALTLGERLGAVYVDLESERDRPKLTAPELYLEGYLDRLVILDEVHRMPGLFPVLRSLVDWARRKGRKSRLYLRQTKERRKALKPTIFQLKLQNLTKTKEERLRKTFLEAKWLYISLAQTLKRRRTHPNSVSHSISSAEGGTSRKSMRWC